MGQKMVNLGHLCGVPSIELRGVPFSPSNTQQQYLFYFCMRLNVQVSYTMQYFIIKQIWSFLLKWNKRFIAKFSKILKLWDSRKPPSIVSNHRDHHYHHHCHQPAQKNAYPLYIISTYVSSQFQVVDIHLSNQINQLLDNGADDKRMAPIFSNQLLAFRVNINLIAPRLVIRARGFSLMRSVLIDINIFDIFNNIY